MTTRVEPVGPGLDVDADGRTVTVPLVIMVVICLLPYINIGVIPVPSQIQPWGALFAWLWVGFRVLTSGLRITAAQWALLAISAYFMIDVYGGEGFDPSTYLRRTSAYLLSAGIFLAAQYLTPATLWRALKFTIPIWFGFAALRYVDSSIYFSIVRPLVPTVVVSEARGTSSLAPEATDFGFTMVFVLVLCTITRRRLSQQGMQAEKWPLVTATVCALLSLSGTGYLGLAVVGAVYILTGPLRIGRIGRVMLTVLLVLSTLTILSWLPSQPIRGLELLRLAVHNPVALMDTTTSYRIVHTVVGFFGMIDSGFWGYGAGSFQSEALDVYYRHNLGQLFGLRGHYAENVPASLVSTPSSQIAIVLLEFGIIGVLFLIILFGVALRSRIPLKAIAIAILLLAWLGSFPAAWPPFWILIGIMMSPHFVQQKPAFIDQNQLEKRLEGPPL